MTTMVWYASPDAEDKRQAVRYDRVAFGAREALDLLRDAEQIANERSIRPDPEASRLLVLIDQPGRLFTDTTHGLLVQARANTLTRAASRRIGVRVEIRW